MSSYKLLIINGAILTVCAVFDFAWRTNLLIALMLFLPLLDKNWVYPELFFNKVKLISWCMATSLGLLLLAINPDFTNIAINTLLFAAIPEEWFFRAYLMQQLARIKITWVFLNHKIINRQCSPLLSNILTSALFSLLHTPTQGWFGLSVFFPSLFYGWIYQRSKDIVLVILLHALSNIVFFIYLAKLWGTT